MASRGYPQTSSKSDVITGQSSFITLIIVNILCIVKNSIITVNFIGLPSVTKSMVFHMGTKLNNYGEVVTNGGRVLIVVTTHQDLVLAAARATMACRRIVFNGAQFRTDIAHRGIARY